MNYSDYTFFSHKPKIGVAILDGAGRHNGEAELPGGLQHHLRWQTNYRIETSFESGA
jgi:hypothetical protein